MSSAIQQRHPDMEPQVSTPHTSPDSQQASENTLIVTSDSPNATVQPMNMPVTAELRARVREAGRRMKEQVVYDPSTMCHSRRTCMSAQFKDSTFCEEHCCQDRLADGNMCPNFRPDKFKKSYCSAGWHSETGKDNNLKELLQRRDERQIIEADIRALEEQQDLELFDSICPSLVLDSGNISPSSSTRSLPVFDNMTSTLGGFPSEPRDPQITSHLLRPRAERGWGSPGIDLFLGSPIMMGMRYRVPVPASTVMSNATVFATPMFATPVFATPTPRQGLSNSVMDEPPTAWVNSPERSAETY